MDRTAPTTTLDLAVFDSMRLVGHRRLDRLHDATDLLEGLRDTGYRALPLSPSAQAAWAARTARTARTAA